MHFDMTLEQMLVKKGVAYDWINKITSSDRVQATYAELLGEMLRLQELGYDVPRDPHIPFGTETPSISVDLKKGSYEVQLRICCGRDRDYAHATTTAPVRVRRFLGMKIRNTKQLKGAGYILADDRATKEYQWGPDLVDLIESDREMFFG